MENRDEGQSLCRLCVWVKWDEEEEKERWRFWNQVESRDENGEDGDIRVYVCGGEKTREKKKGYVWMKERKRKRIDHLGILPQYFYTIFTINFK